MPLFAVPVTLHVEGVVYIHAKDAVAASRVVTGDDHSYGMSTASVLQYQHETNMGSHLIVGIATPYVHQPGQPMPTTYNSEGGHMTGESRYGVCVEDFGPNHISVIAPLRAHGYPNVCRTDSLPLEFPIEGKWVAAYLHSELERLGANVVFLIPEPM